MASYARLEVGLIAAVGGLLTAICAWFLGVWALLPALLTVGLLSFYRDPPRRCETDPRLVLAPADGRVVEVSRGLVEPDGGRVLRIMIFLSVFDVHVNRSPCAGEVTRVEYRRGTFHSALRPSADASNECNTVTITPRPPLPGPVRVRQIAGILARRIVCTARPGDRLTAGQRFGMIKLGSRTEVCLPEDPRWEVCVAPGDRARAGLTVLARLGAAENS